MQTIQKKISELNPAEYNPRHISEVEFAKLKRSLMEFGLVEPIVINKDNQIIGGHQRVKAAEAIGWTEVDCIVVDLEPHKAQLLNLALNRIQGEWDYNKLYDILVKLEGDDIKLAGFDVDEVKKIRELLSTLDEELDLSDDFEDKIKQIEMRVYIQPDHPQLNAIRYAIKKVKEDYPDIVIKEIL